jgi:hypothetical protein
VSSRVKADALPGKFDGLYGGGTWFGWDQGKLVLRGVMRGHPLAAKLPLGSVVLRIGGDPAWLATERERRRVAEFLGISSAHSFFASLGNRMLPFGDAKEVEIALLGPDLETSTVALPRWGPGGRAYDPEEAHLPEGVAHEEGACSGFVALLPGRRIGYVAITGGMDEPTEVAFQRAFDRLEGLEGLVLDCRAAGGGSDESAWAKAGRLFSKGVDNGRHGRIDPSGAWQFDGPLVVLQGELDVSSAETFLWAVSETGRAITVGRTSGGWGIIPKRFRCPSGLVEFRLGVNDRPTPIKGVRTEGAGWPPDVLVPLSPHLAALGDPERRVAGEVLAVLCAGVARDATRQAFRDLFGGNARKFAEFAKRVPAATRGFDPTGLAKLVVDDVKAELAIEREMLKAVVPPDVAGAAARIPALVARARAAGIPATDLERALDAMKGELAAQQAFLEITGTRFEAPADRRKAWLGKHGETAIGRWARERAWRKD